MTNPPNRVNSYERKKGIDSNETDMIGGGVESVSAARSGKGIEIDTDRVISTDALDQEAFMRDELEVFFNEPQNENDAAFVELNVNGDYRMVVRGNTATLRRYHVAVLANAKQSRVRQRKIVAPDGSMGFQEENVLSLTYPFQVMHDPNPQQGVPWLKKLLQQPA
jgi:hypothetical protein